MLRTIPQKYGFLEVIVYGCVVNSGKKERPMKTHYYAKVALLGALSITMALNVYLPTV